MQRAAKTAPVRWCCICPVVDPSLLLSEAQISGSQSVEARRRQRLGKTAGGCGRETPCHWRGEHGVAATLGPLRCPMRNLGSRTCSGLTHNDEFVLRQEGISAAGVGRAVVSCGIVDVSCKKALRCDPRFPPRGALRNLRCLGAERSCSGRKCRAAPVALQGERCRIRKRCVSAGARQNASIANAGEPIMLHGSAVGGAGPDSAIL
jgi:hypothetical protein